MRRRRRLTARQRTAAEETPPISLAPCVLILYTGLTGLAEFLWRPLADARWASWRDFWLREILDDRLVIVYCLPLVPILLLTPPRHLRTAIILTGLAFVSYAFGAAYVLLWLAMALAFHALAERFAVEVRRTDVLPWGPPLAALLVIVGWYLATQALAAVPLSPAVNEYIWRHLPWLYPLGGRSFAWEPYWLAARPGEGGQVLPFFGAVFWNPHNIGTAYFTIRMVHYFADIERGLIPPELRTRRNFLAYVCYAPGLMQGPIERFQVFQAEMDDCHTRRGWRTWPPALARLGWALVKVLIASLYFKPVLRDPLGLAGSDTFYRFPERIESYGLLYFGVFIQIFWLYLEFSAYCDVSAAIARVLGYRQVENFNWPWLATSMRDFWRRWHISLSLILRDYLYIPLGGNRNRPIRNAIVTFAICGVWHVPNGKMIAWGVVMGLMVGINQHWARWMKHLDENPKALCASLRRAFLRLGPVATILAWAVTMHAFCWSLLIFFGGYNGLRVTWELVRRPLAALGVLG